MKLLIVIALCVFSVFATDFTERLQKVIDENRERVTDETLPREYLANMNATHMLSNMKSTVKRNQGYYEQETDKHIRKLKELVDVLGALGKKCTEGKGKEVVAVLKQIKLKYNVCIENAEKFLNGLRSAFTDEFKRILDVYNNKSINIISDCVKDSGNEDKTELCVMFKSGAVKDEALTLVKKLQKHLINKFDEILNAFDTCRAVVSSNYGLTLLQKIASNDKEIKACLKANS